MSMEDMQIIYTSMCKIADVLVKEINPCNFIGDKCIRENHCCHGRYGDISITCQYLSKTGCTIENLYCKLTFCKRARTAIRKQNPNIMRALKELVNVTIDLGINELRCLPEQCISEGYSYMKHINKLYKED